MTNRERISAVLIFCSLFTVTAHAEAPIESVEQFVSPPTATQGYKSRSLVQPTLADGSSQRFDSHMVKLSAAPPLEAQVAFSRLFPTLAEAQKAPALPLSHFPWTAEKARQFQAGDASRLEIAADGSIEKGFAQGFQVPTLKLPATFVPGDRLVVDLYRQASQKVQLRITSVRDLRPFNAEMNLDSNLKLSEVQNSLNAAIAQFTSCAANGEGPDLARPIETFVVDFVFDLSQPRGIAAFETTMKSLASLRFETHFNLLHRSDRVENVLLKYTAAAEIQFRSERNAEPASRAVDRPFKVLALTRLLDSSLDSGCFELWNSSRSTMALVSSLRIFDENNRGLDQLYAASIQDQAKTAVVRLFSEQSRLSSQILISAPKADPENSAVFQNATAELSLTRQLRDRHLRPEERGHLRDDFVYQYPDFAKAVDWNSLPPTSPLHNAFARWTFLLSQSFFESLPRLSADEVLKSLRDYIDRHPDRDLLLAPKGSQGPATSTDLTPVSEREITQMAQEFGQILNSTSVSESMRSLARVSDQRLPQEVGLGFLLSLLPPASADTLVHFDFILGSDNRPLLNATNEVPEESATLKSVTALFQTLGERSFDLPLQIRSKQTPLAPVDLTEDLSEEEAE